jgi:DNA-binding PadR family transcriptional regulator
MRDEKPNKPKVQRILNRLQRDKLITQGRKGERYEITENGKKVLKQKDTDGCSNAA